MNAECGDISPEAFPGFVKCFLFLLIVVLEFCKSALLVLLLLFLSKLFIFFLNTEDFAKN